MIRMTSSVITKPSGQKVGEILDGIFEVEIVEIVEIV